MEDNFFVLRSE